MMFDPIQTLNQSNALDPAVYQSSDLYEFELENIIASGWQCVAPAALVANVGDLITREIADKPIVIVRNANGELNGFFNICRHRAGPLATCDQSGVKRLRCKYHGWAYDLDGQLKIAPEMGAAEEFERQNIALKRIDVVEWRSMIFARAKPGLDFGEIYDSIDQVIPNGMIDGLQHHASQLHTVACNWKVYIDNFLEGYHLPFVHPALNQAVNYAEYTSELSTWWSLQRTPVTKDTGAYSVGEGLYFFVYPNVMLNIMPGRLQSNRVVPTGLETSQVEFDFYYSPAEAHRLQEDLAFSAQVQEEDKDICQHVQKGLISGAYEAGRLSPKRESGVWHFQNILRREYADFV